MLDDATEFLVTSDFVDGLDFEVLVEDLVVHPDSIVWPAGVIVVQRLTLERSDEGLAEDVGLGRFGRDTNDSRAFSTSKVKEFLFRVESVPVANQELWFDTNVFEPHGGVAGLLHDPAGLMLL